MEKDKIVFKGSHPDSLYRVANDSGVGAGTMARTLRVLRWPIALLAVCVALAVFVYFLMPDGIEADTDIVNATNWEANVAAESQSSPYKPGHKPPEDSQPDTDHTQTRTHGIKTPEIDFYEAESDKTIKLTSTSDTITETTTIRKLPVPPVFPTHLTPEVQYGNEKADTDKLRSPKLLEETNAVPDDFTLKPHITQKPEKPLAIYFKEGTAITSTSSTETITKAETINDFIHFADKRTTKTDEPVKSYIKDNNEKPTTVGIEDSPAKNYFTDYEDNQGTKKVEERLVSPHLLEYEEKQTTKRADENLAPKIYYTEYEERAIHKTVNEPPIKPHITNYAEHQLTKNIEEQPSKSYAPIYKDHFVPIYTNTKQTDNEKEPDMAPIIEEISNRRTVNADVNFTSGHSKLFGISIEDAEKMKSTTQSSLYNTRVSPTLPTWRDGDDTTTKKYPININSDVPLCRSTRLPICRGVLPYDLAGPAASMDGLDITSLLSQIEYLVATNCSDRVRHFACALLEPECSPSPYPPKMPCFNLCREIADSCDDLVPRELSSALNCNQYSNTNCVAVRSPCFVRELPCGDGTCVPRDWMCDGTKDCPGGEDEATCVSCDLNEFRCPSGGCILKRWLCDGYADCPAGEDETEDICGGHGVHVSGTGRNEPGEESAGSAPAPAVRRPNHLPSSHGRTVNYRTGENDSSKELLITSDSNNALKRNFTRRPSLSRLTPYSRPMLHDSRPAEKDKSEINNTGRKLPSMRRFSPSNQKLGSAQKKIEKPEAIEKQESGEDVNIEDLGFFGDLDKDEKGIIDKKQEETKETTGLLGKPASAKALAASTVTEAPTRLDKSINKLERVIDGAAMMRKAEETASYPESTETNSTFIERNDDFSTQGGSGLISAHASPCPSGELRCVDGRCITLAQLCDGTIDCSDHADEDNCFT